VQGEESRKFESRLREKIVGQDEAVQAVVDLYRVFRAGLEAPSRPIGNLLFLGPTGTGKTRIVEVAAEALFGDSRAVIKVECAEFQHSHEIAKLIGSPPGYLGHRETHPVITQEALAQYYTDELKISFLLFDEIEKASDALWQLLLGILDKATLTLGNNRRVDLSRSMIFMSSNLGASEISVFRATQGAKDFLLREGTDLKYGARHLKRAIERHVVYPLASLLATDQVTAGETISIDWNEKTSVLTFLKKA
jgi:ATP-dependent Clp protease ATP-binding subunit ClpA